MSTQDKFRGTLAKEPEKKARPISGFVSKSILTSDDGVSRSIALAAYSVLLTIVSQLFGDNFAEKEIEKTAEDRRRDDLGSGNATGTTAPGASLYEQLGNSKEKKQEEFDALVHANRCRKLPLISSRSVIDLYFFSLVEAPAKLDEEDVGFLDEHYNKKLEREAQLRQQDSQDTASFGRICHKCHNNLALRCNYSCSCGSGGSSGSSCTYSTTNKVATESGARSK
jgi:hypothetical protein